MSAPAWLLTLAWGGRTWRRTSAPEDVTRTGADGVARTYQSGLWGVELEERCDLLAQTPDGARARLELDLGIEEQSGLGWPVYLLSRGHVPSRLQVRLDLEEDGRVSTVLTARGGSGLRCAPPEGPAGWLSLEVQAGEVLSGAALLLDPDRVLTADALTPPAASYRYEMEGLLVPAVLGQPGQEALTPATPAYPVEVILGGDVHRVLVGSRGYSGDVWVYDGAGTRELLPVEDWVDDLGSTWSTVDISGSTVLDLQSTSWAVAWPADVTTERDGTSGEDLGTLGGLLRWALRRCGLRVLSHESATSYRLGGLSASPGAWESVAVGAVLTSADPVADLVREVLLPSYPLALLPQGQGAVVVVELDPALWGGRVVGALDVAAGDLEAVGPVQVEQAEALEASHLVVEYGEALDGSPLGSVEVQVGEGVLWTGGVRREHRLQLPLVQTAEGATLCGEALARARYRPHLAREYVLRASRATAPRAGDVVELTDPTAGAAGVLALVAVRRWEGEQWGLTLLWAAGS